jgi:hypothetical protein
MGFDWRRLFGRKKKGVSPGGTDRAEWDRAWRAMPYRRIDTLAWVFSDEARDTALGGLDSVTISQCPPQFTDRHCPTSGACPVCGGSTEGTERLPAALHRTWAKLSFGREAWVHRTCFERCPDAGEPRLIPW